MSAAPLRVSDEPPRGRDDDLVLLEAVRIRGWERLLFIECGDGWVAEEGWRRMAKGYVCGLDRSSQQIALAARLRGVPGRLEFGTWDGCAVPYPDGRFDAVVLQGDVRRWSRPERVLRETGRVARPGGAVYLTETRAPVKHGTPEWSSLLAAAGLVLQDVRVAGEGRIARILHARVGGGAA
jgi:ubiquinone/menaquinone biosynthesis C-methylase UbiE